MDFMDRINQCNSSIIGRFGQFSAKVGGELAPALYDAPFRMAEQYEGQIETNTPACSMLDPDLVRLGVKHGTRLSIYKGDALVDNFEVIGTEPDGLGMTRLTLTKD